MRDNKEMLVSRALAIPPECRSQLLLIRPNGQNMLQSNAPDTGFFANLLFNLTVVCLYILG